MGRFHTESDQSHASNNPENLGSSNTFNKRRISKLAGDIITGYYLRKTSSELT